MVKFLFAIFVTAYLGFAFAATNSSPFLPEVNARFRTLEALPSNLSPTTNGIQNLRVARFQYDVANTGGTSSATAKSLGVTLPAGAIIWDGALHVDSIFIGASSVALACGSAPILATQAITSWTTSQIKAIGMVGTAASASAVVTACSVAATVTVANTTSGKLTGWLLYFVKGN